MPSSDDRRPVPGGTSVLAQVRDALSRGLAAVAPEARRGRIVYRVKRAGTVLAAEGPSGLRQALRERHRNTGAGRARLVIVSTRNGFGGTEPGPEELDRMRTQSRGWSDAPLISIVMPTYNPRPEWIRPAVESVIAQTYENWELCIADDASTAPHVAGILAEYAAADPRIKLVMRTENGGIAAASASAAAVASGEFVGFLDHDDVLRPHALHRVVETVREAPDTDIVYSDEDLLLADGTVGRPFFKPDYSPDLLLSVNYMCHFLVVRKPVMESAGGFRTGFDGAQDHDLLLRATEKARRVSHVPDMLYSWRQVPGSVALFGRGQDVCIRGGQTRCRGSVAAPRAARQRQSRPPVGHLPRPCRRRR